MEMKSYRTMLFLLLAGCSAQPYDQINIWTSTNVASDPVSIQIGGQAGTPHTVCIQSDNARLRDLVRRIAEHEDLTLQFDAEVGNAFCTVNLSDVEPMVGLACILEMHDCVAVQTNSTLIIENKKHEAGVAR